MRVKFRKLKKYDNIFKIGKKKPTLQKNQQMYVNVPQQMTSDIDP